VEGWTSYQCLSGDGKYVAVAVLPTTVVNVQTVDGYGDEKGYHLELGRGEAGYAWRELTVGRCVDVRRVREDHVEHRFAEHTAAVRGRLHRLQDHVHLPAGPLLRPVNWPVPHHRSSGRKHAGGVRLHRRESAQRYGPIRPPLMEGIGGPPSGGRQYDCRRYCYRFGLCSGAQGFALAAEGISIVTGVGAAAIDCTTKVNAQCGIGVATVALGSVGPLLRALGRIAPIAVK
jgi:hypothetical protein